MPLNIKDLAVTSRAFDFGERIPDRHTADHDNVPTELEIHGVPADAVELALIVHDPDAPLPFGFTHWVVYGIDAKASSIGASADGSKERTGPNTLGEESYSGPQPPQGHGTHHYYFWVYALNTRVTGEPIREEFLQGYADNIIEQNRLIGTYSR